MQAKQFGGHVEARVFGIAGAPFGNVRVSFDHPAELCFNVFRQDGRIARKVPRAQALVGELEEPQGHWSRSKDGQSTMEAPSWILDPLLLSYALEIDDQESAAPLVDHYRPSGAEEFDGHQNILKMGRSRA